jgi:RNA polymerase sigma-70 factor (ECF subfamily)
MTGPDDTELVRRTLAGDREAFGALVERYQKPLFNLAYGILEDADDAEEVAQEAFVKAYESLASFDLQRKFFSWLYRIALNEALTATNRKRRFSRIEGDVADDGGMSPSDEQTERESLLRSAVNELKEDHRVVVILKHLQGLSYVEISQILNTPEKTVKSRLFSARLALRRVLEKKGFTFHA